MTSWRTRKSRPKIKSILEQNWRKLKEKLKVMITDEQEVFIKWMKTSESDWRRVSTILDCPGLLQATLMKTVLILIWLKLEAKQLQMALPNGTQLLLKLSITSKIQKKLELTSYHQISLGKTWMATILSETTLTREVVVPVTLLPA